MDNGIENNYGIEKKELYLEIRIVNNFLLIAVKKYSIKFCFKKQ